MAVAPLIAEVLKRQNVKVTFFAANERTKEGDGSLGEHWAPWWKARAAEGHEFASHTWGHDYWQRDLPGRPPQFQIKPSAGENAGRRLQWSAAQYCQSIARAADRLTTITGRKTLPLFRAPGGKTSPALLAAAEHCGYKYVGWSPAGFLGDELPSGPYPNAALLKKALAEIRAGRAESAGHRGSKALGEAGLRQHDVGGGLGHGSVGCRCERGEEEGRDEEGHAGILSCVEINSSASFPPKPYPSIH